MHLTIYPTDKTKTHINKRELVPSTLDALATSTVSMRDIARAEDDPGFVDPNAEHKVLRIGIPQTVAQAMYNHIHNTTSDGIPVRVEVSMLPQQAVIGQDPCPLLDMCDNVVLDDMPPE